ncbi:alpha/beta-hydrolase [Acephala macrosclerotiorum]|nr:alpha/beta-hydrolase [Acephala macrosclerotiorum]
MFSSSSLFLLSVASTVVAQFVPPPIDLINATGYMGIPVRYKEVPTGICELDPNVKSYSGYVDVAENEHIFFWFFEARDVDPTEAPLTVWINGGPGSSSMIGLFQELGPCGVDYDGNVYSNPYSWSNVSNMIFVDQPTQELSLLFQMLPALIMPSIRQLRTLQGFMGAFKQYSRRGFHFATESYGGHYGPIFNEYIEEQNAKNISGAHKISLETVMIGNGWYDPLIQYQAYYNFTVFPGNTYDYDPFNASVKAQMYNNLYGAGNCVDQINDCAARGIDEICAAADAFCANLVENIYDIYLDRDEYDIRELNDDPFPYGFFVDYLNSPEVQAAVGAYQNYSESSNAVYTAFTATGDDNREFGTVEAVRELVSQGITVMLYAGDADYNCNWLGGQVVAHEIEAPGFECAGYVNLTTSDDVVHGQVKQAGKFSFVRIYESGHEVPFYQPVAALEIFERAINGKDIATGKVKPGAGYLTEGTVESTYREGNGTIQFEVLPPNATYNYTLNGPNPTKRDLTSLSSAKRGSSLLRLGKKFKP